MGMGTGVGIGIGSGSGSGSGLTFAPAEESLAGAVEGLGYEDKADAAAACVNFFSPGLGTLFSFFCSFHSFSS